MTIIKHTLPDYKEISILPLADLHMGDIHCDFKRVMEWIDYVKSNDNVFAILNGDLMDVAIMGSIASKSVYVASLNPMEQLQQCVAIFEPIRDKILAVLPGNHELRLMNDGLDLTEVMCSQLGIVDRYASASALLFVRVGKDKDRTHHQRPVLYTIFVSHGRGGGRKEGGKLQRLVDLSAIVDADIYVHSHTHLPIIAKTSYYRVSGANSTVSKVDKLFVNTSSALEYGAYAELQNYKPNSLDTPVIHLDGTRRKATATL